MKLHPQQVSRAGEMFVAAEIHRRGGYAVTFAGNMPEIDILATDASKKRRVSIQVKTKTSGTWHARVPRDAVQREPADDESDFWVFLTLDSSIPRSTSPLSGGCRTTSTKCRPPSCPAMAGSAR